MSNLAQPIFRNDALPPTGCCQSPSQLAMHYLIFTSPLSEHHQLFSQYHTARTIGAASLARALAARYLPFSCYHLDTNPDTSSH